MVISKEELQKINLLLQEGKEILVSYQISKQKIILKEVQKVK